jgi:hypothetical protein
MSILDIALLINALAQLLTALAKVIPAIRRRR